VNFFAGLMLVALVGGSQSAAAQTSPPLPFPPQETWAEYLNLAELVIEKTRKNKPAIASEAAERYENLPAIIDELAAQARRTGGKGIEAASGAFSAELNQSIEKWIAAKSGSMETEIRFVLGRIRNAERALAPVSALVEERERKQQVIAKVVAIIADLVAEKERRDKEQRDLQIDKGKTDKLEPSAVYTPIGDRRPRYAIKE
jgi:hypothetical protein